MRGKRGDEDDGEKEAWDENGKKEGKERTAEKEKEGKDEDEGGGGGRGRKRDKLRERRPPN